MCQCRNRAERRRGALSALEHSLALVEIIVAMAVCAQHFRFRLVPGQRIEPIGWTNLHPKGGIRMTVEPRAGAAPAAQPRQ